MQVTNKNRQSFQDFQKIIEYPIREGCFSGYRFEKSNLTYNFTETLLIFWNLKEERTNCSFYWVFEGKNVNNDMKTQFIRLKAPYSVVLFSACIIYPSVYVFWSANFLILKEAVNPAGSKSLIVTYVSIKFDSLTLSIKNCLKSNKFAI